MTPPQIASLLQREFGERIVESLPDDKHPRVHVGAADWRSIAEYLLREPSLKLNWLQSLCGVDYVADEKMCVVYDLWSFDLRHGLAVKVYCPRDDAHIPSVVDLWAAADWQEREAYDMFGIRFDGHPDLRRILMWEQYKEGFPLRKDFPLRGRFSRSEQLRQILALNPETKYSMEELSVLEAYDELSLEQRQRLRAGEKVGE
jgi:NADH-quinone oxidoreductase subunit C